MPSVTLAIRFAVQTTHIGEVPPLEGTSTAGFPNASSATPATRAHQRRVGWSTVRMLAFFRAELNVAEPALVEVGAQELRDAFRIPVGHEAEVDFPSRLARNDRLRAGAVATRFDPAHVAGRLEDRGALGGVVAAAEGEQLDAHHLPRCLRLRSSISRSAVVGLGKSS
jgi:hypothetical protein